MSTTTTTTWTHLERKADWPYKQLFVKGSNVPAYRIYSLYRDPESPQTPEELGRWFDLPPEAIREAIAYSETNPPEVREDRAFDEARVQARLREACHATMCAAPPRWPWAYLDRKPGSMRRQFVIKGRNIPALSLYSSFVNESEPVTLEEIAAEWELPMAAVLEALAYCTIDPPEIREEVESDQAFMRAHPKPVSRAAASASKEPSTSPETVGMPVQTHEAVPG